MLRGRRYRVAEYGDEWPLLLNTALYKKMAECRSKIIDLMDPRNGLLDAMFSAGCLNRRDNGSEKWFIRRNVFRWLS